MNDNKKIDMEKFEKTLDEHYVNTDFTGCSLQDEIIISSLDAGCNDELNYMTQHIEHMAFDMKTAVKQGYYTYWLHAIEYMHEKYNIEFQRYSYLIILRMTKPTDHIIGKSYDAIYEAIDEIADEESKTPTHIGYLDDMAFLSDKSEKQTNLLQEYFKLLHELKVFHSDKNQYETKEERDKYDELMKIYCLLIGAM